MFSTLRRTRGRRLTLALAAVTLLAACAPAAPSAVVRSAPHDLQAATNSITRAQGLFYTNKYSDAEAAFREALAQYSWYGDGHAAFALFLNYQHRFTEAAGEVVRARALDTGSGYAAAVDTRVHDWSAQGQEQLKAAAAVGAQAIKVGPHSALAHTFYSETLADTGDTAAARSQLETATPLASTAYEKSEVEREKANLALDTGDKTGQLAHLKAAQDIQSGWAERSRELAEYYFVNDQVDQAVALVRRAISLAPRDASLRLTLGAEALLRQDVGLADESYTAANDIKPHDPGVESTLAMTHFTLHHDAAEAERLLRAATADAPNSVDLAALLEGFLRYVKGDSRAADAVTVGSAPAEPLNPRANFPVSLADTRQKEEQQALDTLNRARATAGLAPVHIDNRITSGATAHAYWWLFNLSLPAVKGLGIHREVPGSPGFTGVTMRDRSTRFGYPQASMAEDITHRGDPAAAIKDWVDSVYHRFPLMIPTLDAIGFGEATGGGLPIDVLDMGYRNEAGDPHQIVVYPAAGQADVPAAFLGNELPDPVPPGGKYPTGYPVTLNFNQFVNVTTTVSQVRDPAGNLVDSYILPATHAEENVLTILPRAPLQKKTTYQVHVTGTINGTDFTRDWSFTTES
ncbi:MAG: CAP domain-containing protein [Candidatus Dormibacteria bacterium]